MGDFRAEAAELKELWQSPYKPYENWICFPKATGFRNQDFLPLFQQVLEMISEASTVVCSEKDDRICIE